MVFTVFGFWVFIAALSATSAGTFRRSAATAVRLAAVNHAVDNRLGTPDSRLYPNCIKGTIERASAALHASVPIRDGSLLLLHDEYAMRTDLNAPAASGTLFRDQFQ